MSYLPICVSKHGASSAPLIGQWMSAVWSVYVYVSGHMVGEGLQSPEEISEEKNNLWCKGRIEDMHFSFVMWEHVFGKGGGRQ